MYTNYNYKRSLLSLPHMTTKPYTVVQNRLISSKAISNAGWSLTLKVLDSQLKRLLSVQHWKVFGCPSDPLGLTHRILWLYQATAPHAIPIIPQLRKVFPPSRCFARISCWKLEACRRSSISAVLSFPPKLNASTIQFDKRTQSCNKGSSALLPAALAESTILLLSRLSSAEQSYWTIIQSMRFQLQRACDKLSSKVCTNSDRCLKSHQRQGPLKLKSETSLKSYAPASKMPFHYQLNLCHCCLVPLLLNYCYAMISQNCRPTLVDFGFEHDINP